MWRAFRNTFYLFVALGLFCTFWVNHFDRLPKHRTVVHNWYIGAKACPTFAHPNVALPVVGGVEAFQPIAVTQYLEPDWVEVAVGDYDTSWVRWTCLANSAVARTMPVR